MTGIGLEPGLRQPASGHFVDRPVHPATQRRFVQADGIQNALVDGHVRFCAMVRGAHQRERLLVQPEMVERTGCHRGQSLERLGCRPQIGHVVRVAGRSQQPTLRVDHCQSAAMVAFDQPTARHLHEQYVVLVRRSGHGWCHSGNSLV